MKITGKTVTLAAIAAAVMAGAAYAAATTIVQQKSLSFGTDHLTVKQGDIVQFDNLDTTSHNIIVAGEGVQLNSGLQQPGVSFKAPMLKKGKFQVMCGIHPKMKMTIDVE